MDAANKPTLHVSPEDARARPNDPGHPSVRMLSHGSMELRWYRPREEERHLPHDRDECYIVVAGSALFHRSHEAGPFEEHKLGLSGSVTVPISTGHAVMVPAGCEHWFADISSDFELWTMFWGPEGGEQP